jgi:hypothetical protein
MQVTGNSNPAFSIPGPLAATIKFESESLTASMAPSPPGWRLSLMPLVRSSNAPDADADAVRAHLAACHSAIPTRSSPLACAKAYRCLAPMARAMRARRLDMPTEHSLHNIGQAQQRIFGPQVELQRHRRSIRAHLLRYRCGHSKLVRRAKGLGPAAHSYAHAYARRLRKLTPCGGTQCLVGSE